MWHTPGIHLMYIWSDFFIKSLWLSVLNAWERFRELIHDEYCYGDGDWLDSERGFLSKIWNCTFLRKKVFTFKRVMDEIVWSKKVALLVLFLFYFFYLFMHMSPQAYELTWLARPITETARTELYNLGTLSVYIYTQCVSKVRKATCSR